MHDSKWIREHAEEFDRGLARRGHPPAAQKLIALDERRRAAIAKLESALARRNAASKEIGQAKAKKDEARAAALMAEVGGLKAAIDAGEEEQRQAVAALDDALAQIPNLPLDDVPDGASTDDNVEHHRFGARRNYGFEPKQHFDLGEALGLMDFETAAKLSGARFVVLKGALARLERALAQFMLDVHTGEHGYSEIAPPLLVRDAVMFGTAQLPKFAEDQFYVLSSLVPKEVAKKSEEIRKSIAELGKTGEGLGVAVEKLNSEIDSLLSKPGVEQSHIKLIKSLIKYLTTLSEYHITGLAKSYSDQLKLVEPLESKRWLIPTAEVPLTNLVREEILAESQLPLRFTAGTPCFRAEAGAAGKDTRGMIRQHQFTKVELVSIITPEQSRDEHERMLACAEEILRWLDLHYP